jgi:hypothetical protein
MTTKYKHIEFNEQKLNKNGREVTIWLCRNHQDGVILGWVEHHKPWKQYVFAPRDGTMIFSVSCLQDIIHFIGQLK